MEMVRNSLKNGGGGGGGGGVGGGGGGGGGWGGGGPARLVVKISLWCESGEKLSSKLVWWGGLVTGLGLNGVPYKKRSVKIAGVGSKRKTRGTRYPPMTKREEGIGSA